MEVSGQKTTLAQRGQGTGHQMADSDGRAGTSRLGPAATTVPGADGRSAGRPSRGRLRIYLGSAAGGGETYAILNEGVQKITGVPRRETGPDAIGRAADEVEMVDMTPEALRRRMAHGNIYPPEKIDAALTNYFRSGNLAALRELALLWLADKVDEGLQRYRVEHKIQGAWEARERVVVALTGGPEGQTLIRPAARISG